MAPRAEVLGHGTRGGEDPWGVPWRREPWHPARSLAGGLRRVCRAVMHIARLAVFHSRPSLVLGGPVALQVSGHDHAGHLCQPLQQLSTNLLRRGFIPATLPKAIEDHPLLVHGSPARVTFASDGEKPLAQMPRVTWRRASAPELMGLGMAELPAPCADRFRRDDKPTCEPQCFDITRAQAEGVREPHVVANHLRGEAVMVVMVGRHCGRHAMMMSHGLGLGRLRDSVDHANGGRRAHRAKGNGMTQRRTQSWGRRATVSAPLPMPVDQALISAPRH
jgi:hypothetical protein